MSRLSVTARLRLAYGALGALAALALGAAVALPTGLVSLGSRAAARTARAPIADPSAVAALVNQAFAAQGQQAAIVAIVGCSGSDETTCRVVVQTQQGAVCARLRYRVVAGAPRVTELRPIDPAQCQTP